MFSKLFPGSCCVSQCRYSKHCVTLSPFWVDRKFSESNVRTPFLSVGRCLIFLVLHCLCGGLRFYLPRSSVLPFHCLVLQAATRESWSSCGWPIECNTDAASEQKGLTPGHCCLIHSSIPKVKVCSQGGRTQEILLKKKPFCFMAPGKQQPLCHFESTQCHLAVVNPALKWMYGSCVCPHMLSPCGRFICGYRFSYGAVWFQYIILKLCNGLCWVVHLSREKLYSLMLKCASPWFKENKGIYKKIMCCVCDPFLPYFSSSLFWNRYSFNFLLPTDQCYIMLYFFKDDIAVDDGSSSTPEHTPFIKSVAVLFFSWQPELWSEMLI